MAALQILLFACFCMACGNCFRVKNTSDRQDIKVYHGSRGVWQVLGYTSEFHAVLSKKFPEKSCGSESKGCNDKGKKEKGDDITLHWRRSGPGEAYFSRDEQTIVAPNNALILFEDAEKGVPEKGIRVKVYRDSKEKESHVMHDKMQHVTFEKQQEEKHKTEESSSGSEMDYGAK